MAAEVSDNLEVYVMKVSWRVRTGAPIGLGGLAAGAIAAPASFAMARAEGHGPGGARWGELAR